MRVTDAGIDLSAFTGWVPFAQLPHVDVPDGSGVYVVARRSDEPPAFLPVSPAGHFKGKDPTRPVAELDGLWVPGAHVVYIGKANLRAGGKPGLSKRLSEFRKNGAGSRTAPHSGGHRIWQLADHAELLVAWRETEDCIVGDVEADLIAEFRSHYGMRPFANMNNGRRRHTQPCARI